MGILHKIVHTARLSVTLTSILKYLSTQRLFLKVEIAPVLSEAEKQNDGSLDHRDLKR